MLAGFVAVAGLLIAGDPAVGELQVIRTHNVRDIVITILGSADAWTTGENRFVMEFDSATRKRLVDVGVPTLSASLPSAGQSSLQVAARLTRADVPGRYIGAITLPRPGNWSVTVAWTGAASPGSATFSVPARQQPNVPIRPLREGARP